MNMSSCWSNINTIMDISIVSKNITTDNNTINVLFDFICYLCNKLNFSHENIYKIIFADEYYYGSEIIKVDPDEGYTNTPEGRGFGKTIYINNMDKSVIIIRIEIFQYLVKIINENTFNKLENQLPIFLILHEIGHCITHSKQKKSIKCNAKSLKINEIPYHYFSIIIDEFTANRNIITFISKEWVLYELKNSYLNDFILLSKNILNFRDIIFVQNIWYFFKRFMDIGAFFIDIDLSEYISYIDKLELPFDIKIVITHFISYNQEIISEIELFNSLSFIVNNILDKFYKKVDDF
jgi:hypothetical protein